MTKKILLVDDEQNVLDAYMRTMRKRFSLETADSGAAGVEAIVQRGPFAVVVSDMRMPGMDGVEFLRRVKEWDSEIVRVMLTGNADVETAIRAVNEGAIFRFLNKPCFPDDMALALEAALEQHRLIRAERDLLEKTLSGSIQMLTEILALVNPTAFGRAARVKRLVRKLSEVLGVENAWQVEIAAMLSQIGCVALPEETLEKVYHGKPLDCDELDMLQAHPEVGRDLLKHIPRLEPVAEIIEHQELRFNGSPELRTGLTGSAIPIGARVLKVALDFEKVRESKVTLIDSLAEMRRRGAEWYDPIVLDALSIVEANGSRMIALTLPVNQLKPGMVFAKDVVSTNRVLLVREGQEVTTSICLRLRTYVDRRSVSDVFDVTAPAELVEEFGIVAPVSH